jgi:hypothetical protein
MDTSPFNFAGTIARIASCMQAMEARGRKRFRVDFFIPSTP